jgi:heat-inducible transcriptional repressor
MEQLTDRQQQILALLTKYYVETGTPVGSSKLVSHFGMDVSSATVRNEMSVLSEKGYLVQLHTSAGRIPSEKGYRYFVQKLVGEFELPSDERHTIRHQFHQARLDMEQWMRLAAAVLARASTSASIVTAPQSTVTRFKHLQLISTQGRLVLLIVVFYGGEVKQEMLALAEPLSQAQLSSAANRINQLYDGKTHEEILQWSRRLDDALDRDVTRLLLGMMTRADSRAFNDIYRDGLVNILEDDGVRQAVRVLEERTFLASLLSETLKPGVSGVQVVIGGEGRWEELRDCTVILSRYGVADEMTGALAVFGPTRMTYSRNISAVRYVANLMSNLVQEYYIERPRLGHVQTNEVID